MALELVIWKLSRVLSAGERNSNLMILSRETKDIIKFSSNLRNFLSYNSGWDIIPGLTKFVISPDHSGSQFSNEVLFLLSIEQYKEAFLKACEFSLLNFIIFFLRRGADPLDIKTALNISIENNNLDVVKLLFNIRAIDMESVYKAAKNGNLDVIYFLYKNPYFYFDGDSIFGEACDSGNLKLVKFLISKGFSPGLHGITPAFRNNDLKMIKLLCGRGIFPGEGDILLAAMSGYFEIVKFLYRIGFKIPKSESDEIFYGGDLETIKYLVDNNLIVVDSDSANMALLRNNSEILNYLSEMGIEPTENYDDIDWMGYENYDDIDETDQYEIDL